MLDTVDAGMSGGFGFLPGFANFAEIDDVGHSRSLT